MATTRSLLRAAAERYIEPGKVLERTNEQLYPDIPQKMFVTCLYAVFDPANGHLVFANAGHNLPYIRTNEGVIEPRATGMPLGLMPGMKYDEAELILQPGDNLLLDSDGLIEAHNPQGEMFSFERTKEITGNCDNMSDLIQSLIDSFKEFTGDDYEQEDDITLLMLGREPTSEVLNATQDWTVLANFEVPSEPGNERQVAQEVMEITSNLNLEEAQLKRLETAVAEAALNAMEHGNKYQPDLAVEVQVLKSQNRLAIRIKDHGGGAPIPNAIQPDLQAKLDGQQSPRGWGLFLIRNMVDEVNLNSDDQHHTIELIVNL